MNGVEPRDKPHTLMEYAIDHFRYVSFLISLKLFIYLLTAISNDRIAFLTNFNRDYCIPHGF